LHFFPLSTHGTGCHRSAEAYALLQLGQTSTDHRSG
jgi:hypothetical protein